MAITTSHIISFINLTFSSTPKPTIFPQSPAFLKLPTNCSTKFPTQFFNFITPQTKPAPIKAVLSPSNSSPVSSTSKFYGICYVVQDNVNTDQIIPSNYTQLNPSNPDDYKQLGSHAFVGLPNSYALRFVEEIGNKSKYSVIISGKNFGCGSLNEHAIVALNSAGIRAVIAESFDGGFLQKLDLSGQMHCLESMVRICDEFKTGDVATIDVEERILINQTTGKSFQLKT
ncbi:3-isopropylmalate dehydratase small subunit 3 [Bienertia sinuspersici]